MESPDLDGASWEWDYKKPAGLKSSRPSLTAKDTTTHAHPYTHTYACWTTELLEPTLQDWWRWSEPSTQSLPVCGSPPTLLDSFPHLSQKDHLSRHLRANQSFFFELKCKNITIMRQWRAHSICLKVCYSGSCVSKTPHPEKIQQF